MNSLKNLSADDNFISDALYECSNYLDQNRKFGTFTLFSSEHGANREEYWRNKHQSYLLQELPDALEDAVARSIREKTHLYISQSTFRKRNRQRASFLSSSVLFVDLDIYSEDASFAVRLQRDKEYLADKIEERCIELDISLPSITIDSGRGMYAKWVTSSPINKQSLPYWEAIQSALCRAFADFGADKNAKDVSRVLRVVDSVNWKTQENKPCRIMRVNYEELSQSSIKTVCLSDFEPILKYSLTDAQEFMARMAVCNKSYAKNGAIIRREKHSRLLILDCLKELDGNNFINSDYTAKQLHEYIKSTRQLNRLSLPDCDKYLTKFLVQKGRFEKAGYTNTVVSGKRRFNLVRRNWGLYTDVLELADHRYNEDGVADGMRDIFLFIACNQYASTNWARKEMAEIILQYNEIAKLLAPHWTKNRINHCVKSVLTRLKFAQETKDAYNHESGLYKFGDNYLIDSLNITTDELQLVGSDGNYLLNSMIGDTERNRRDPERLDKRSAEHYEKKKNLRRSSGVVERKEYEDKAKKETAKKKAQAKRLKKKGLKNIEIATKMGVTVRTVINLTK